jgi:hypothetical protein
MSSSEKVCFGVIFLEPDNQNQARLSMELSPKNETIDQGTSISRNS